jgi:hypothetical protein
MKCKQLIAPCLIAAAIGVFFICGNVYADDRGTRPSITIGEAVTGANRLLGQPLYAYDFAPPPTFGFNTVDELDPGGPLPLPLTPASNQDAILVTTFPNLAAVPADVMPNINVPLREVETFINGLLDRSAVPFHLDPAAPIIGPSQAAPGRPDPIRLRDWLKGRGVAFTRCGPDANHITLSLKKLIPNRLYSAYALWLRNDGSFRPVSLGGAPSVIMTNERGEGHLSRKLNFCPEDAAVDGIGDDRLISIAVIYHSAHVYWGAIPTPAAQQLGFLLPPGSIVHAHVWFDFGAGRRVAD